MEILDLLLITLSHHLLTINQYLLPALTAPPQKRILNTMSYKVVLSELRDKSYKNISIRL